MADFSSTGFQNVLPDPNNTIGAIYIVRDPRNIITSLKNHFSFKDYKEAKKFLNNKGFCLLIYKSLNNLIIIFIFFI